MTLLLPSQSYTSILEEEKTGYAIRLPANQVIQEQIQPLLEPLYRMASYAGNAYGRAIDEFLPDQAQSWRLPRSSGG